MTDDLEPAAWENLTYDSGDGITHGGGVVKRKESVDWPDQHQRPLFAADDIADRLEEMQSASGYVLDKEELENLIEDLRSNPE